MQITGTGCQAIKPRDDQRIAGTEMVQVPVLRLALVKQVLAVRGPGHSRTGDRPVQVERARITTITHRRGPRCYRSADPPPLRVHARDRVEDLVKGVHRDRRSHEWHISMGVGLIIVSLGIFALLP